VQSFFSSTIWSILSSALKTTSVPWLDSRLLSFMRTVAELRPPREYSVLSTTQGAVAVHDHVAGADFLGDFHGAVSKWAAGAFAKGRRRLADGAGAQGASPLQSPARPPVQSP